VRVLRCLARLPPGQGVLARAGPTRQEQREAPRGQN